MIGSIDYGMVPYRDSLRIQHDFTLRRTNDEIQDHLLFFEHPPVFTMGRQDSISDLLVSEDWIYENGMDIIKTDRGGRMTYHGPGQLIVYLIFRLQDSIPRFIYKIESCILDILRMFYIIGERDHKHPGIWVSNSKIASVGLHIEKGITSHGFALNVSCDLKPFRYIYPCGIADRGVTSLEEEMGWRPPMRDVKHLTLNAIASTFKSNVSVEGIIPTQPE